MQNLEDERTRMVSDQTNMHEKVIAGVWKQKDERIKICCFVFFVVVCVSQIENANDVLILPLERFRKEQISAAKVRKRHTDHGTRALSSSVDTLTVKRKISKVFPVRPQL